MADKVLSSEDFDDLFSTEIDKEDGTIKGIGKGRGKLEQNISSLKLPKAALAAKNENESSLIGRGRGSARMNAVMTNRPARLPKDKDSMKGHIGIHNTNAFPPLPLAARKTQTTGSPKTSHKQQYQHSSSDSEWPSLGSYK